MLCAKSASNLSCRRRACAQFLSRRTCYRAVCLTSKSRRCGGAGNSVTKTNKVVSQFRHQVHRSLGRQLFRRRLSRRQNSPLNPLKHSPGSAELGLVLPLPVWPILCCCCYCCCCCNCRCLLNRQETANYLALIWRTRSLILLIRIGSGAAAVELPVSTSCENTIISS